jgi:hypothetical protein
LFLVWFSPEIIGPVRNTSRKGGAGFRQVGFQNKVKGRKSGPDLRSVIMPSTSSIGPTSLLASSNILSFHRLLSAHLLKQGSQLVFVHGISSHDSADYGIRE